ncbi:hypothetical protein RB595_002633 [Gaeumannomyces hyphopodioides]
MAIHAEPDKAAAASTTYSEYKYGTLSDLQTLGIWDFRPSQAETANGGPAVKYWVVFIHGGAWRDPRVTLRAIEPTIAQLVASPATSTRIAGVASIDYRLTAHPDFPQDPTATPPGRLRNARHPDHVRDVAAAMTLLASLRPLAGPCTRYVLAGHSAGATLALQLLMGSRAGVHHTAGGGNDVAAASPPLLPFPAPAAIIGYEGLYDLRGICARKGYAFLFAPPFGDDEDAWDRASPALHRGFAAAWDSWAAATDAGPGRKRLVVIAQSPEDELVDMDEALAMERALRDDGVPYLLIADVKGKHNEVLEAGTDIVRVLVRTVGALEA